MSQSTATSTVIDFITRARLVEYPAEAVFEAVESIEEMTDVGELVRRLTRTAVASR